jgi:hypothetical protein
MAGRLSRRALARQAMHIQAQVDCAVSNLDSPDEQVRADAVRQLCPCRTHVDWTLERYVLPMLHDPSPVVRRTANFVLTEELDHELVREAQAAHPRERLRHFVWNISARAR